MWRSRELFADLRSPQTGGACTKCAHYDSCRGGCMAAKFFTGLPLDGPDPECIVGYGEQALAGRDVLSLPKPDGDHSHGGPVRGQAPKPGAAGGPVPVTIGHRPDRGCDESPLVGLQLASRPERACSQRSPRGLLRASFGSAALVCETASVHDRD